MIYFSNLFALFDISRGTIELGLLILALLVLVDWYVSKPRYRRARCRDVLSQNRSEQPMHAFNCAA